VKLSGPIVMVPFDRTVLPLTAVMVSVSSAAPGVTRPFTSAVIVSL
jgi:hypothetical protein